MEAEPGQHHWRQIVTLSEPGWLPSPGQDVALQWCCVCVGYPMLSLAPVLVFNPSTHRVASLATLESYLALQHQILLMVNLQCTVGLCHAGEWLK